MPTRTFDFAGPVTLNFSAENSGFIDFRSDYAQALIVYSISTAALRQPAISEVDINLNAVLLKAPALFVEEREEPGDNIPATMTFCYDYDLTDLIPSKQWHEWQAAIAESLNAVAPEDR